MSRNIQETKSILAVSRAAQADLATAAALAARFQIDSGGLLKTDYDREDDADDITGFEGASEIIPFGYMASGEFAQKRAKPDFILWALAFALGDCSSVAAGSTGYQHTITPQTGSDMDSFTAVQVLGETLLRERYLGNVVNEFALGLTEKWITARATIKSTGKKDVDWVKEDVSAAENATSLTVALNIQGATEAARLDSIHSVRVKLDGDTHYTEVTVTGSPAATSISITAPGGTATVVTYEVFYVPEIAAYFTSLPSVKSESYLRVQGLTLKVGADWDGTTLNGGRTIASDFLSGELKLTNEGDMRFVPGSGIDYAGDFERQTRMVAWTLSHKMRDIVREYQLEQNEYFSGSIKVVGAEYETSHNFEVEIILPKLGISTQNITVNNKLFAVEGDLMALAGTYDKIIVVGKNQVATYLA